MARALSLTKVAKTGLLLELYLLFFVCNVWCSATTTVLILVIGERSELVVEGCAIVDNNYRLLKRRYSFGVLDRCRLWLFPNLFRRSITGFILSRAWFGNMSSFVAEMTVDECMIMRVTISTIRSHGSPSREYVDYFSWMWVSLVKLKRLVNPTDIVLDYGTCSQISIRMSSDYGESTNTSNITTIDCSAVLTKVMMHIVGKFGGSTRTTAVLVGETVKINLVISTKEEGSNEIFL